MDDNVTTQLLPLSYQFVPDWAHALWAAAPESFTLIRESANIVFRFEANGHGRYLRLTNIWARKLVVSALDYLCFLVKKGAPVCKPIPSANGRYLEEISHNSTTYMARVYAEIPGQVLTNRCSEPAIFTAWGRAIAQLHQAAATYQPDPDLYFWSWEAEKQELIEHLPSADTLAWAEYEKIMDWFDKMPPLNCGFGVAHGDANAGNFIWNGRDITIIDFDEPLWHWFAADIARPFREITDFPLVLRRQLMAALVQGYRAVRPLDEVSVVALPWFIRLKDLAIYAWELSEGTAPTAPHIRALRQQFTTSLAW